MANNNNGQGWHGDSEGHRKAGKAGGESRSRKNSPAQNLSEEDRRRGGENSHDNQYTS